MCDLCEFFYHECGYSIYELIDGYCEETEVFNNGYCPNRGVVEIHVIYTLCPGCIRYPTPD
jgi:hypothetical protein